MLAFTECNAGPALGRQLERSVSVTALRERCLSYQVELSQHDWEDRRLQAGISEEELSIDMRLFVQT